MNGLRSRLSYANVAATLALFLALGGTSYALIVTGDLVKDESLTGADVRNDSLKGSDVDEQSLGAVPRAASATTAENAGNAQALGGLDSTAFVRDLSQDRAVGPFNSISGKRAAVVCPPGKKVIAGAGSISGGLTEGSDGGIYTHVAITAIEYSNNHQELDVWGYETEPTNVNWAVIAEATCARVD